MDSIEEVRNHIINKMVYDVKTGSLTFKKGSRKGCHVGSITKDGYYRTKVKGKNYLIHRLVWLYNYGAFPDGHIDHINHNTIDNRLLNLRVVTSKGNNQNRSKHKNNKSGVTGVFFRKDTEKWKSTINISGRQVTIGYFENKKEAIIARKQAEIDNSYHINHGKDRI